MINSQISANAVAALPSSHSPTAALGHANQLFASQAALAGHINSQLPSTQLPLLLSIENLDQMALQLRLLTKGAALSPQLQPLSPFTPTEPSGPDSTTETLARVIDSLFSRALEVIPLHQLATLADRSLAQAVRSLQINSHGFSNHLSAKVDSAIDFVAASIRELLISELSTLASSGEKLRLAAAALSERAFQLATGLALSPRTLPAASNSLHRYANRFLVLRPRRQEYTEGAKQQTATARRALPEHILQILARIVVRILRNINP